jgi:hypothetical protein
MFGWLRRTADDLFGRSGAWPRVRREHLEREPCCIACGRSKTLEVHHVVPYHEDPGLELDPGNLVTLCADPCHLVHGHLLNWKLSNPHVREDAGRYRERIRAANGHKSVGR